MSLRVLLVHSHGTDLTFGGAERHVAQLAEGLAGRGIETRVLSAFPGQSTLPPERTRVLHGSDWRADRSRRLRNHVGDVLSRPTRARGGGRVEPGADVVHTNNPGITTGIWEVCRRAGIAVVHTLHDYHLLCPRVTLLRPNGEACEPHPLLCGLRTRRMARWAPAVSHLIGVSRFVLSSHAQLFPGAKLELVHLPVDVTDARLAPPGERLETLGFIGALEPIKGSASSSGRFRRSRSSAAACGSPAAAGSAARSRQPRSGTRRSTTRESSPAPRRPRSWRAATPGSCRRSGTSPADHPTPSSSG